MTSDHLVIDARADYVLCVNDGLLAASLPSWRDFLAGYLTREKEINGLAAGTPSGGPDCPVRVGAPVTIYTSRTNYCGGTARFATTKT